LPEVFDAARRNPAAQGMARRSGRELVEQLRRFGQDERTAEVEAALAAITPAPSPR
jgi:hypothetical protein